MTLIIVLLFFSFVIGAVIFLSSRLTFYDEYYKDGNLKKRLISFRKQHFRY